MKYTISIFGTGYVGLIQGVALHSLGNKVFLVDVDKDKIKMINDRVSPIYEEGLNDMLRSASKETLIATLDYENSVRESDIIFICVGTPTVNGKQDTSYIEQVSKTIGNEIKKDDKFRIVVVKSTVYPGTTKNVVQKIIEEVSGKKAGSDFGISMNPEFLREGTALHDFFHGDRIVIGVEDEKSEEILLDLYSLHGERKFVCTVSEAEIVKYASNSFLAVKISFANEIGNLCKALNLDSHRVLSLVGKDSRIGEKFFGSGIGYGGSCFPKDVSALESFFKEINMDCNVISAARITNDNQPLRIVDIMKSENNLKGLKVGVLGLSFKIKTDDVRESPSIKVIRELLSAGAIIYANDPVAIDNMKHIFPDIKYYDDPQLLIQDSDIITILTEWEDYESLDYMSKKIYLGKRLKNVNGNGITW